MEKTKQNDWVNDFPVDNNLMIWQKVPVQMKEKTIQIVYVTDFSSLQ